MVPAGKGGAGSAFRAGFLTRRRCLAQECGVRHSSSLEAQTAVKGDWYPMSIHPQALTCSVSASLLCRGRAAVSVPRVQSEWCFHKRERKETERWEGETENETGVLRDCAFRYLK